MRSLLALSILLLLAAPAFGYAVWFGPHPALTAAVDAAA